VPALARAAGVRLGGAPEDGCRVRSRPAPRRLNEKQHACYRRERVQLAAFLTTLRSYRWLPGRRRAFLGALERLRRFCWWREEMRDLSSQVYDLIRRHAVEIGRRWAAAGVLPDGDAILMLTYREIYDLSEGRLAPGEAQRRVAGTAAMAPPSATLRTPTRSGSAIPISHGPARRTTGHPRRYWWACLAARAGPRHGAPDPQPEEAHRVAAGEVLVTTYTDPGWTPC